MTKESNIRAATESLIAGNAARKGKKYSDAIDKYIKAKALYLAAAPMEGEGDDVIEANLKALYTNLSAAFIEHSKEDHEIDTKTVLEQALAALTAIDPKYKEGDFKSNLSTIHYKLGQTQREAGDFENAIASQKEALTLHPGLLQASYELALSYQANSQSDEAILSFQDSIQFAKEADASDAKFILNLHAQIFIAQRDNNKSYKDMLPNLQKAFEFLAANKDEIGNEKDVEVICLELIKAKCLTGDFDLGAIKEVYDELFDGAENIYMKIVDDAAAKENLHGDNHANYLAVLLSFQNFDPAVGGKAKIYLIDEFRLHDTETELAADHTFTAEQFDFAI